jgi:hypothetical protein
MSKTLALVSVLSLVLCAVFLGLARMIGGDDVFHDPHALEGIRPLIDMATRKEWRWAGGDTLAMDAPMTLRYQPQGKPNVTITGPAETLEHVRFNAGRISADKPVSASARGKMQAVVSGIAIRKFVVNGGEVLELGHVDQDRLDIHINGLGRVRGDGKVRKLSLSVSGPGQADLGDLSVGDASISVLGSGMARLSPHGKVSVFMAGSGRVALLTKPDSLDKRVIGSGLVSVGRDSAVLPARGTPPTPPVPPSPEANPASGSSAIVRDSENLDLGRVDQDHLDLTIAASGNVTAVGTVNRLKLNAMSSGRAELGKLAAREADVNVAGSGDVTLGPVEDLRVTILGSGNVRLSNQPANIHRVIVGSGRVIMDKK